MWDLHVLWKNLRKNSWFGRELQNYTLSEGEVKPAPIKSNKKKPAFEEQKETTIEI